MGFGSAILELNRKSGENENFRSAVLYACTHDTCLDAQIEDSRVDYLYEAVGLVGNKDYFLKAIIKRMETTDNHRLISQLCGLLYMFWKDGFNEAGAALRNKFSDYLSRISRIKKMDAKRLPADTLTILVMWLCDMYGVKEFFSCAESIGLEMVKRQDSKIVTLIWLIPCMEEKFGKTFMRMFEREAKKSLGIRRLLEAWQREKEDSNRSGSIEQEIDANNIISLATSNARFKYAKLTGIGRMLEKKDVAGLRLQLADFINSEIDEETKTALMYVFHQCDYPYPLEELLELYETAGSKLKSKILSALCRFKDARLRELAVCNLNNGLFVCESLMLLYKYFDNDYDLVSQAQKLSKKAGIHEYHEVSMAIRDLLKTRKSALAQKILLYDYHNNRCSFCRNHTVEIMCKNRIIPGDILEECLYDCVWDTRQLAKKYKARKKE